MEGYDERLIQSSMQTADEDVENILRPRSLREYVGQEKVKDNLSVFMKAALQRGEPLDHCLFYGPPGLGKTTLSHIIASEMKGQLRATSGPSIERAGDLAAILTNLAEGDILFIDEIHRLSRTVEEILYPAMEDFVLDFVIGKGPSAKTIRLDVKPFTLIGATTKIGLLSAPLRSRFGVICRLEPYDKRELASIIMRSAGVLGCDIDEPAAVEIASRSRGTPRIANRLLKRVRDFSQVSGTNRIDEASARRFLDLLEVDRLGLDNVDVLMLGAMIDKFGGGPVGLDTIAASIDEDAHTIEDVYEPYLIQLGFINRTPRGRVALPAAYEHLGKPYKAKP